MHPNRSGVSDDHRFALLNVLHSARHIEHRFRNFGGAIYGHFRQSRTDATDDRSDGVNCSRGIIVDIEGRLLSQVFGGPERPHGLCQSDGGWAAVIL